MPAFCHFAPLRLCARTIVLSIALTSIALAAEEPGITVSAIGEAKVNPNRLEIEIKAGAAAELTGDAVVKYRDALKRTKESFDKLKIDKLELVDRGTNVANSAPAANQNNFNMPGNQQGAVKPEVNITKSLRLAVTGIDKLSEEELVTLVAKLLDAAKDAGVAVGSDSNNSLLMRMNGMSMPVAMVTFVADDPSTARKQASEDAFKQAKEKAQRLAAMAGAQLGGVLSMEEGPAASGREESMQERLIETIYGGGQKAPDDPRLTSPTLLEMPVRVNLRVRFALEGRK
jgi:uncharacterized protein YggE